MENIAAVPVSRPRQGLPLGWLDVFFAVLALFAVRKLFQVSELNDADFHVYWKAAHDFATGLQPYAPNPEAPGFLHKYPPWTLPFFYPLSFFNWPQARHLWFVLELISLVYCLRWVIRQGVSRHLTFLSAFLFWWIWQSYFGFGQVTLLLLAGALWGCPTQEDTGDYPYRTGMTAYILSSKIFYLVAMVGMRRRALRSFKPALTLAALLIGNLILVVLLVPQSDLLGLHTAWMHAAASGGQELGETVVRGFQNHSLTTRVLTWFQVSALNTRADVVTSLSLSVFFGALWFKFSRKLRFGEQWAGWVALSMFTHPLAWDHSYVMAFPLCALALARTSRAGRRTPWVLAIAAIVLIGLLVPQIWGADAMKPIELAANKAWGVVLAGMALVVSARSDVDGAASWVGDNAGIQSSI